MRACAKLGLMAALLGLPLLVPMRSEVDFLRASTRVQGQPLMRLLLIRYQLGDGEAVYQCPENGTLDKAGAAGFWMKQAVAILASRPFQGATPVRPAPRYTLGVPLPTPQDDDRPRAVYFEFETKGDVRVFVTVFIVAEGRETPMCVEGTTVESVLEKMGLVARKPSGLVG